MSVEVRQLRPEDEEAWRDYVSVHPEGTVFHTLAWRDSVSDAFGHEHVYLGAWRGPSLCGVFPLTRISSRLTGTLLVSIPYAVYGGTLADDEETHRALLDYACVHAESIRAQWLDIRSIRQHWPELPVVKRYVTFRKPLPGDPGEVLGSLPRKARAAARQARERYGLSAVFDDDALPEVWSLYSRSMRRLASPNYPRMFFESLIDNTAPSSAAPDAGPRHLVQLVMHRGKPIGGLLSFIHGGTLLPYFAGSDQRFEKYHPNNFLYLAAMEQGVRLGCTMFDFGRSRVDNAGACDFKRFQGFEPMELHYQYFVPSGGKAPDLHPGNPKVELARKVWPRLPLAVTRPLGAWLTRSIPG